MLLNELFYTDAQLDEINIKDLKKYARTGAVAAGIAGAGLGYWGQKPDSVPKTDAPKPMISQPADAESDDLADIIQQNPMSPQKPQASTSQKTNTQQENYLRMAAEKSGIRGDELAAFLAQTAHETVGFNTLKEIGGKEYFTKKYDISKNPNKAKELGNVKPGDGAKYYGRGYIHLTGRDNYRKAGQALNIDLEHHPEWAERPDVAARVAIWFWNTRVRPNVTDWDDVSSVTRKINHAMQGLSDREANYQAYRKKLKS
jgi:predicted chitinase